MPIWIFAFAAAATALSALGFVAVAVLWLRKLRETVSGALSDSAAQQLHTAHKLGEALVQVQKQQRTYEQQLHSLAQASLKMRQDLTGVTHRLDHSEQTDAALRGGDRTVH